MNSNSDIAIFTSDTLASALSKTPRVYLSGKLERSQEQLPHVDSTYEVGISRYDEFSCDLPHFHEKNYETNYVIEGTTHLMDLSTETVHILPAGSAFILSPKTPYVTKHAAGTTIIFFKAPGGNDKQVVEVSEKVRNWMIEKI